VETQRGCTGEAFRLPRLTSEPSGPDAMSVPGPPRPGCASTSWPRQDALGVHSAPSCIPPSGCAVGLAATISNLRSVF
jgi:hypothetical protein